ncbi:MAG: hypothetical protein JXA73_03095 [Acidobacteria bacterium]|nr:hypothetical protein [Acidobacteriota bacterium]
MRIRIESFFLLVGLLASQIPAELRAQDFTIEEMSDEETAATKPFSISRVSPFNGGLRLFLSTGNPDAIAELLTSGALQAQLSDHNPETETAISLSLGKAVWCGDAVDPVYVAFRDPLPSCDGNPPTRIDYFFEVAASLGPGRDLTIGQDPDFLWLIEER